jgi:hypothetical protein
MSKVVQLDWRARMIEDRAEMARSIIKSRMLNQAIREEYDKEMRATLAGQGHYTLEQLAAFKIEMDQEETW